MRKVEVQVWVDRPVKDVYAYVADLDRWQEWRTDVVGGELLTEGPIRVGSRARGIAKILGRPVAIDVEVTALESEKALGYRPIGGPLRTNNLYTFERSRRHPGDPYRRHWAQRDLPSVPSHHAGVRQFGVSQQPRRPESNPRSATHINETRRLWPPAPFRLTTGRMLHPKRPSRSAEEALTWIIGPRYPVLAHNGHRSSAEKPTRIASDPDNLVAVSTSWNRSKSRESYDTPPAAGFTRRPARKLPIPSQGVLPAAMLPGASWPAE
jgi:hypothetical protein